MENLTSLFRPGFRLSLLVVGTALGLLACSESDSGGTDANTGGVGSGGPSTPATTSGPVMGTAPMSSMPLAGNTGAGNTGAGATGAGNTGAGNTGAGDTGAGNTAGGDTAGPGPTASSSDSAAGGNMGMNQGAGGMGAGAAGAGGTPTGGMGGAGTGAGGGMGMGMGGMGMDMGAGGMGMDMGAGGGGTSGDEDLDMTAEDFSCIGEWDQVLGFRITNLLGHLDEAIAVAESTTGGTFPVGTILQHLPTEAMVKRRAGFSPETNDWEFFILELSQDGTTTISQRGTTDVTTMGQACAECHSTVPPEYDFVCNTWGEYGGSGNCGFDFMPSFLDTQLASDTRCP